MSAHVVTNWVSEYISELIASVVAQVQAERDQGEAEECGV